MVKAVSSRPMPPEVFVPTYEYHCPACKSTYELRQGFDAETTHACEECGNGMAKRILSAPAVVFKGSGWYATDSRNKSVAVTDSSSDSTGDSKPGENKSSAKTPAAPSKPSESSASTEAAAAS